MPFLGSFRDWYRYQTGVVSIPPMQKQNGTGTNQSGTSTTHQNRVGTGIGLSGTGTIAPCSLDFLYFYIIKPKYAYDFDI